ncbi:MAG TPA: alpha/beta fold hydrolase [Dehalococcoidia bacterium]|nr:alpha/beta fold hydrolase [Dehalococcoidia bacterium]
MTEITHRMIPANGINLHIAEAGEGPLVLLLHGFPELWYSWRHQLPALAEAGYHAVAPDVRGYGDSGKPPNIEDYTMKKMVADYIGILDALGEETAVVVGHDWGSPMAWNSAALHPDRYRAVVGMSVPYLPRGPMPPLQMMRAMFQNNFFYILYFQEPGVAEAEFEADVRRSLRLFTWGASGEARARGGSTGGFGAAMANKPADSRLFDGVPEVEGVPPWMTEADLDVYVEAFEKSGFRGPINRYRCMDIDHAELPELQDKRIEQPALFLYGEADGVMSFAPMDPMKQLVPNLKIVSFPGIGHWTQQEKAKEINEALIDFLNGLG